MLWVTLKTYFVVVIGGGSGIGRAVSKLMAREGAKVVVSDFDLAAAETTVSLLQSGIKHESNLLQAKF